MALAFLRAVNWGKVHGRGAHGAVAQPVRAADS